jgi:hypothetical protein
MAAPKLALRLTGLLYPYHLLWWRNALRTQSAVTPWNYQHNAIFVHIPKTAGTSVLSALDAAPAFDTHAPAHAYRQAYPELYARAYKFAFVRNPWDRFASSFHFLKHGTTWRLQQDWAQAYIGDLSFGDFVRRLRDPLFRARVMSERFFWPQTFWLGEVGRPSRDIDIFRFEDLEAALTAICERLDLRPPPATPHLRKVERPSFRSLYDDETRLIVAQLYRHDIKALAYAF